MQWWREVWALGRAGSRDRADNSTCSQEHKQTALQGSIHCRRCWRAPIFVSITAPTFKGKFLDPAWTLWVSHILGLYPYGQSSLWDDVDLQTAQQARLWTNRFSCWWWHHQSISAWHLGISTVRHGAQNCSLVERAVRALSPPQQLLQLPPSPSASHGIWASHVGPCLHHLSTAFKTQFKRKPL